MPFLFPVIKDQVTCASRGPRKRPSRLVTRDLTNDVVKGRRLRVAGVLLDPRRGRGTFKEARRGPLSRGQAADRLMTEL